MAVCFKLLLGVLFPSILLFPAGKTYPYIIYPVNYPPFYTDAYSEFQCHESSLLSHKDSLSDDHTVQKRAECEYKSSKQHG